MTETMIASPSRLPALEAPERCEISTIKEAARALRMIDRELALLRQEHHRELVRQENREKSLTLARLAALAGFILGGSGFVLAAAAFCLR